MRARLDGSVTGSTTLTVRANGVNLAEVRVVHDLAELGFGGLARGVPRGRVDVRQADHGDVVVVGLEHPSDEAGGRTLGCDHDERTRHLDLLEHPRRHRDDDGGRGLNSYLNFASPTGGPYFVGVSSYVEDGTGRYQLRVSDTDVPGHAYTDELLDATIEQFEKAGGRGKPRFGQLHVCWAASEKDADGNALPQGTYQINVIMTQGPSCVPLEPTEPDATVEIWQCDAHGRYLHPGDTGSRPRDSGAPRCGCPAWC